MSFVGNQPGATTVPNGMVNGNGTSFSAGTAGTDYAKPDTGSSWSKAQIEELQLVTFTWPENE